jgi:enoyl-CoA hydratase
LIDLAPYGRYTAEGIAFDEPRPGVLRLRLDRPEKWNAIPLAVHDAMPLLFAQIAEDEAVRAFMLAGSGKVFSSGGDVDEGMKKRDAGDLVRLQYIAVRIITRLLEIPQPTICVVNGPAIGFAASLALHFDFVVCSDTATFYDSHAAFGAAPGDGLVLVAPLVLGPAIAREVLFGGRKLSAAEAESRGLVNRVVPHESVEEEAFALLDQISKMAPLAVRMGKMFVNAPLRAAAEQILNLSIAAEMVTLASEDYERAVEGFQRDRKFDQDWRGR